MILLRVAHEDKDRILQIAEFLLKEHLAIDINIEEKVDRLVLIGGKTVVKRICLLTATTKSLLFSIIDLKLTEMFPREITEIYGLPIAHMDFEQRRHLLDEVQDI